METIKKYANRKLYHTNRKQYITLEGIAALIQAGAQVQVVDNETGEDITAAILSQVVLQARGSGGRLPTQILTSLIQTGGGRLAEVRRSIWMALGGADLVDTEIRRRLERLRARGALAEDEAQRVSALLLSERPSGAQNDVVGIPSYSDVVQLHAQVDALSAVVEQLLAERADSKG